MLLPAAPQASGQRIGSSGQTLVSSHLTRKSPGWGLKSFHLKGSSRVQWGPARVPTSAMWISWVKPCQTPNPSCFPAYSPQNSGFPSPTPSMCPAMSRPCDLPAETRGPRVCDSANPLVISPLVPHSRSEGDCCIPMG